MVDNQQLEEIRRSVSELYTLSRNWTICPDIESIRTVNKTSKSLIEAIQKSIYSSLEDMESVTLTNVDEESWPQEMLNLSEVDEDVDKSKLKKLQKLAEVAQRIFSAQTKANQIFEDSNDTIMTIEEVKIEFAVAVSLAEQILGINRKQTF